MKRSLKNLKKYSIEGEDGSMGEVKDFLFDEESWVIRYIEADFGKLIKNKRVLIPAVFMKGPDWNNKVFPVSLNKENIEACPDLDEASPVSREYEKKLSSHYEIEYYWPTLYSSPAGAGVYYPPRPLNTPEKVVSEDELDTSLRSFNEIKGYYIHATDGRLGHVDDLIIDDEDLQVVYLIIDTSNWVPWSKEVILSVDILEKIDYARSEVSIPLTKDNIKEAPKFDPKHPIDMDYEKALDDYYKDILLER